MKGTARVEIGGYEFDCDWSYSPGRPGTMYRRNGDPGDPPEDSEFCVESCRLVIPRRILGYHIQWKDGTSAICKDKPEHQETGCTITPLIADTENPDLLDVAEELSGFDSLNDMVEDQLDREGVFDVQDPREDRNEDLD